MPMIRITDAIWHSVTLTQPEIWQCRSGAVLVSNEVVVDDDQGFELLRLDARQFAAGVTVRYRRLSPSLSELAEVLIAREAV